MASYLENHVDTDQVASHVENNVDPDQLASDIAIGSGLTLFSSLIENTRFLFIYFSIIVFSSYFFF